MEADIFISLAKVMSLLNEFYQMGTINLLETSNKPILKSAFPKSVTREY